LLFLSAGSVIHALSGEQDIRKMGGLSSKIPWTHRLFLIGTIAIAGIPPLAGFWSKDEIMAHAFTHHHYLLYGIAAVGAFFTAFYMFRLTYLTFYGRSRMDHHTEEHVHESPMVMVGPLMVLGLLSLAGGFMGFPPEHGWLHQFLAPVAGADSPHEPTTGLVLTLMMIATGIAFLGWALAHYLYSINTAAPDRWAAKVEPVYTILLNKYYVDELFDFLFVEPIKKLGLMFDWFDRTVIDGLVRTVGQLAELGAAGSTWIEKHVIYGGLNVIGYGNHVMAKQWRQLQSGMVHHYAAIIVAGLFLLAVIVQFIVQH
ncbi:MAG TPA: proton-conducting transporter membrane subunit, partial [Nitrospira sp.]